MDKSRLATYPHIVGIYNTEIVRGMKAIPAPNKCLSFNKRFKRLVVYDLYNWFKEPVSIIARCSSSKVPSEFNFNAETRNPLAFVTLGNSAIPNRVLLIISGLAIYITIIVKLCQHINRHIELTIASRQLARQVILRKRQRTKSKLVLKQAQFIIKALEPYIESNLGHQQIFIRIIRIKIEYLNKFLIPFLKRTWRCQLESGNKKKRQIIKTDYPHCLNTGIKFFVFKFVFFLEKRKKTSLKLWH